MKKIIIISFLVLNGLISSLVANNWCNPFTRGNEFLIDTNIVYISASGENPSVAFDGKNYLAVWEDETGNISGARISKSGGLIDSAGIVISSFPSNKIKPVICSNGHNYLVVWSDYRNGKYDIYGVRVDTSGAIIDSSDIPISTSSSYDLLTPTVTIGGKYYFIVWKEEYNPTTGYICGARVDTSGTVIDTIPITINSLPIAFAFPSAGFDGKKFLAVWTIASYVYGARIDTSGTVVDTNNIKIASNPGSKYNPGVVFNGKEYLIAWQDNRNSTYDIYGARLDTSGLVIDSLAIPIVTLNSNLTNPEISFNNNYYLLTWEDDRISNKDIYVARVDTSINLLDTLGIQISSDLEEDLNPTITFLEMDAFIVWSEMDNSVYGMRIDTSGNLLDSIPIILSITGCPQWSPACCFDNKNFLVVWFDRRNKTDYNIYGARVDTTGAVIDTIVIPVSTSPVNQKSPDLAFSGSNYFVVWQDDRFGDIYGARIDTAGGLYDSSGINISHAPYGQESPSITFGSKNYFLVWDDRRNTSGVGIYGARVDTSGFVLDPSGKQISFITGSEEVHPSISFNTTNYLIIWYRSGNLLSGALADTLGEVIDTITISDDIADLSYPNVTSDGINYLVTWQNTDFNIYGALVNTEGIVLNTVIISAAIGEQKRPQVAFDGTDYIVLWVDYRNFESDIYGARISTAGIVLDTFALVTGGSNQFSSALANGPGAKLLATYSGFVDSINSHPANTIRIWGKLFIPPVAIQEVQPIPKSPGFSLKQNFPNPLITETAIAYSIPGKVALSANLAVFNIVGQKVKTLVDQNQLPSQYRVRWDCKNDKGKPVLGGIYFYRLTVGENTAIKKMVVFR